MFNSMFDELKEVKYFKEITDFKNPIMQNTLEPKQASTMELFYEYT